MTWSLRLALWDWLKVAKSGDLETRKSFSWDQDIIGLDPLVYGNLRNIVITCPRAQGLLHQIRQLEKNHLMGPHENMRKIILVNLAHRDRGRFGPYFSILCTPISTN